MTYFGTKLRYLRMQEGMSQQNLADALGTSKSSISMYENGHREPSFEILEQFADFFNVSMSTFFPDGTIPKIEKSAAQVDGGQIPKYALLNEKNRAIVDSLIAQLLDGQSHS